MKEALKYLLTILIGISAVMALYGCGDSEEPKSQPDPPNGVATSQGEATNPPDDSDRQPDAETKILVVYFSAPDNKDNSYVEINGERLGNTQYMAYVIQSRPTISRERRSSPSTRTAEADFRELRRRSRSSNRTRPCSRERAFRETASMAQNRI